MNLYLISENANLDSDTYDSAVVAAESVEAAKRIDPGNFFVWSDDDECWFYVSEDGTRERRDHSTWVNDLEQVEAALLGTAIPGTKSGVILASFNAG